MKNPLLRSLMFLLLLVSPTLMQCQRVVYEAVDSLDGDTIKRCKNRAMTGATLFETQCLQNCTTGDYHCTNGCTAGFITLSMALTNQCDD